MSGRQNIEPADEPIELLKFRQNKTNSSTTIEINEDAFDQLSKVAQDLPISLICVCGPSRLGKSFILGYMIRVLENLEAGKTECLDKSDPSKPLKGFKFKNGTNPQTKGIWVWSRPFIINVAEGQEIAVLLVDTQGTNDEYTSNKDMSAIVGLSMLLSSVLVFNFCTNLQEDILQSLYSYVQYGLLALKNTDDTPFQKLLFLIRDWNNPDEFSYGADGGKSFIRKRMQVKGEQPEQAKEVRKSLNQCFQEIDCYLMPHIGEKALGNSFKGSLQELAPKFAKHMELFLTRTLNVESILEKEILGNTVTLEDLKSYLRKYVEIFNSDEIPSAKAMWEATSEISVLSIVNKARNKFMNVVNKKRGEGFMIPDELEITLNIGKTTALEYFKRIKKFGSKEKVAEYEDQLKQLLESDLELLRRENFGKRDEFISTCINQYSENYHKKLLDEAPLSVESTGTIYEDQQLEAISKNIIEDEVSNFKLKMSMVFEESETIMAEKKLLNKINEHFAEHKQKNLESRNRVDAEVASLLNPLIRKYNAEMEDILYDNKHLQENEIADHHRDITENINRSLAIKLKSSSATFKSACKTKLDTELNSEFDKYLQQVKANIREVESIAVDFIQNKCSEYETDLITWAQETSDKVEVEVYHAEYIENLTQEFENDINLFSKRSKRRKDLNTKLQTRLENILKSVIHNVVESKEKAKKLADESSQQCLAVYVSKMQNFTKTQDFITDDHLFQQHKLFLDAALNELKRNRELKDIKSVAKELETKILAQYKQFFNDNQQKRNLTEITLKNLVEDCHSYYSMKMQECMSLDPDITEVNSVHQSTMNTALQKFKDKFDAPELPKHATAFLQQLVQNIDEEFDEISDLIEDREVEQQGAFNSAKFDVYGFYHDEMKKYCSNNQFIHPTELQRFHDSTQTRAVQGIESGKNIAFTKSQIEILKKEMDNFFSKYKQKNAMNAVTDLGGAPAIGIDLGTTYCCVAVYHSGKITIISNFAQGNSLTTPSYVVFGDDGSETIGEPAKSNAHKNPENTIYDAKRIIGRSWDDPVLQADIKYWPFRVINEGGSPKIKVNSKTLYPEQISAILLDKLREMAEQHLKLAPNSIQKAVITVPAYFDDGQRQATVDAGELAGLEVLTILNEPTAASIAYSLERLDNNPKKVLIFDLGGGTFDVAVLDMKPGNIDVIAVDGDTHLGGEDFDKKVMKYCAAKFLRTCKKDIMAGKDSGVTQRDAALRRIRRLQTYCEKAKKELATALSTEVSVDAMMDGVDLSVKISREKFEELNRHDFEKTITIVDNVLKKNAIQKEEIDDIVLVGGSSRIPKIQELLTNYFNGKVLNRSIHPDHAVAHGAAVQAAIMSGEMSIKDMPAISDVTPYSIGVEVVSKEMSIIIPANTKVPCKRKEVYRTAHNFQTQVKVKVFQGEDTSFAANNKLLGEFTLTGIPSAPAGREVLDVWMEVNFMGILHVEAICKSTRSKGGITINENKNRLSKEAKRKLLDG